MTNKQKQQKFLKYFAPVDRILELGSGGGDFLELCEENRIYATGIDKDSEILVEKFKNSKYVEIKRGDAIEILSRINEGVYSGVYLRHVIEHFSYSQIIKLLRRIYKILKKDGKVVIIFPDMRNYNVAIYEFWNDITHVRPYTYEIIEKLLEQENFKIIESSPDFESWDNSFIKNVIRKIRSLISGIKQFPPDYYIVAKK